MKELMSSPRCVVIAGPQGTGKTQLARAMIKRAGAEPPAFDGAPESQEFATTTDLNFARCDFLGEPWRIIDCPGSVELTQSSLDCLPIADIVVVVADPSPDRAAALGPYLRALDESAIPHVVFINRVDAAETPLRDVLAAAQTYSARPLVLRQAPIREDGRIIGAVDLVSERAWRYREGAQAELIALPESARAREAEARAALLDTLADFDDALLEKILEDATPPSHELFAVATKEVRQDLIVPVVLGSASHGYGVTRLWKMLRHEAPSVDNTAARMVRSTGAGVARVFHSQHAPHTGKLSVARIMRGAIHDGAAIDGARISGVVTLDGAVRTRIERAEVGEIVGLPRFDGLNVGDLVCDGKVQKAALANPSSLVQVAIHPKNDRDDGKLSAALAKLVDEDSALSVERRAEAGELVLGAQGEMHVRLTLARLRNRFGVDAYTAPPTPSYRETIRGGADQHARHKKQSGGHGQFADIKVRIAPRARGAGFMFSEEIHGGSVPRQFIPAVEAGIRDGLERGPLGFPVVDLAVTLYDGQYHAVDSNEMSFRMAGRQAIREALPICEPTLLEPLFKATIHAPSVYNAKVHGVVAGRRGQILGFNVRSGWLGWDSIDALLPEASFETLILELRSVTQGLATFVSSFSHYQEVFGKDADRIVNGQRRALAAE